MKNIWQNIISEIVQLLVSNNNCIKNEQFGLMIIILNHNMDCH